MGSRWSYAALSAVNQEAPALEESNRQKHEKQVPKHQPVLRAGGQFCSSLGWERKEMFRVQICSLLGSELLRAGLRYNGS